MAATNRIISEAPFVQNAGNALSVYSFTLDEPTTEMEREAASTGLQETGRHEGPSTRQRKF
jgi:hypothetical protein